MTELIDRRALLALTAMVALRQTELRPTPKRTASQAMKGLGRRG